MFKKSLKSIWFWSIFLPLFYALCGFLVLPWLALTQIPPLLKEQFNLKVRIEKIDFNPFTFELNVNHLSLYGDRDEKIFGLNAIFVDYAPSLLFKKEIFIQTLIIDTPSFDIQRDSNGTFNITQLFDAFPASTQSDTPQQKMMPLSFLIGHVEVKNGDILFEDASPQEPFSLHLGPLNYTINNLGFQKDDLSIHALKMVLQNQEKISLASSVTMEPLKFNGKIELQNIELPPFWAYTMQGHKATLQQGELSLSLPFTLDLSTAPPQLLVEKANLSLYKIIFQNEKQKTVIDVPELLMNDINVKWPKAEVAIETLSMAKPFVDIEFQKNYEVNLGKLFMSDPQTKKTSTEENKELLDWKFALKNFTLKEGSIDLLDTNIKKNGKTKLSKLDLILTNITNDANQSIGYEMTSIIDDNSPLSLKGSLMPSKMAIDATLDITALPLSKAQPYLEPFTTLSLKEGKLSLKTNVKASFEAHKNPLIALKSSLDLKKLVINDALGKPILAWDKLLIDTLSYNSIPQALHVGKITLEKPYVNLDIKKDKSTNFANIFKPSSTKKSPKSDEKPMEIILGAISLKGGSANFKDASLPIPFATFINALNGSFSAFDTTNTKPSKLLLEGKVDKYGYSKIEATLLPLRFRDNANLKILFKNIDMPSLTPYSGKFVGYAIQKGKLSMDLSYKIKKGIMDGSNKINLDSLTLGDKIESEEAVNLPLGLAIAILKDSKGQIDLNLPVSGDLNDPDFKYGAIVWKAFGNLIGSILTSPFSLIGSILGIETETLKSVEFSGGEYQIIASEEEKMDQYRQILEKKPELKLIITPSFNEEVDTLAIKEKTIEKQIEAITKGNKEENSYGKAIKTLFVKKFSQDTYDNLIKGYKDEKLDIGTMNDNLKSKIALTLVVTSEELNALANQRADAIIQNLTQIQKIASPKILKGELKSSDAIRESWVGCEVIISN